MKTYKLLKVLTFGLCSLFLSCNEEEMPSQIPTQPRISGIVDGDMYSTSVRLSVTGADVEDDLRIEYVYYISDDNNSFKETPSEIVGLSVGKQYWWYAVAVSKNNSGHVFGSSEPTPVYTFYCGYEAGQPKPRPIPTEDRKVIIIPIGDIDGIRVSEETVVGKCGEVKIVDLSLDEDYEISYLSCGSLSSDNKTLTFSIGYDDYYIFIEVKKRKSAV